MPVEPQEEGDEQADEWEKSKMVRLLPDRADKGAILATRISDSLANDEPVNPRDVHELRDVVDSIELCLARVEELQEVPEPEASARDVEAAD